MQLRRPTENCPSSITQIKILIIKKQLKKYSKKFLMLTESSAIPRKDKIMINLAENMLRVEVKDQMAEVVSVVEAISHQETSIILT